MLKEGESGLPGSPLCHTVVHVHLYLTIIRVCIEIEFVRIGWRDKLYDTANLAPRDVATMELREEQTMNF